MTDLIDGKIPSIKSFAVIQISHSNIDMKSITIVSVCSFGSLLLVAALYYSVPKKEIVRDNGFKRHFKDEVLSNRSSLDLAYNSYYLAGLTNESIFLGNYRKHNFTLQANYPLTDTLTVSFSLPKTEKRPSRVQNITINTPDVFIADRLTPLLFHAVLPEMNFNTANIQGIYFDIMVPLNRSEMIFRTYDPIRQQKVLKTASLDSSNNTLPTYVLEKQVDGVFCTDGFFLHNQVYDQVLYVYYYRNQYVGLNSRLDVVYKGNTIDTVSQAKVQIGTIASENKKTLVKRPGIVNKRGAVYGDKLYIGSGLIADNESVEAFETNSIVDVYSLQDQSYQFSFYIPAFKKLKTKEFKVYDDKLVAIYSNYLVTYEMNFASEEKPVTVSME